MKVSFREGVGQHSFPLTFRVLPQVTGACIDPARPLTRLYPSGLPQSPFPGPATCTEAGRCHSHQQARIWARTLVTYFILLWGWFALSSLLAKVCVQAELGLRPTAPAPFLQCTAWHCSSEKLILKTQSLFLPTPTPERANCTSPHYRAKPGSLVGISSQRRYHPLLCVEPGASLFQVATCQ